MSAERGRVSLIRDPAYAVAAAKCWLSRTRQKFGAHHPEECSMCDIPAGDLIASLTEFATWSGLNYRENTYDPYDPVTTELREEVERWVRLPQREQRARVMKAQGYDRGDD